MKTAAALSVFPGTGLSFQQIDATQVNNYGDVLAITADGHNDPYPVLENKTGLKIQKIETFHKNSTLGFVKITADNGSVGWGQVSTYDADISINVLHRKITEHFLGEDPSDLGILVDRAIEANYKYPWSYVCRALSGVDTAVWDLLGKHEGKSVCELLGGRPRPFPVYGSSMSRSITPEDESERLKKLYEKKGYPAFKVRVGSVNGHNKDAWPGRTENIIPSVRKALGDDVKLLVDANSCYAPTKAIEVGRMLQEYHFTQFEEPCPYWELEWTTEVTQELDMAVSGGEQDNELATWRRMINMHAVDIVQPDILYLGGVTRTLRVAKKAEQHGIPCVPHSANRAMVTLFTLHVMGALPNAGDYVEFSIEDTPWAENIFAPEFEVIDGKVAIPSGPGWGVTINDNWLDGAKKRVSTVENT
ncbi:mandelate racemase/muconate lactonizing enzyme family protein [Aliifodinibius sp. S!AR15-10]|nr:mandelate racemase/muconate lactonizing enzyme family protein [Aliifodinibius sp. S!AR15-10]